MRKGKAVEGKAKDSRVEGKEAVERGGGRVSRGRGERNDRRREGSVEGEGKGMVNGKGE